MKEQVGLVWMEEAAATICSLLSSPPSLNAEEYGAFLKEREEKLAAEAEARAAELAAAGKKK